MLDIKFVRENPDIVKQNIKNKFQDEKLPLVDEVIELYGRQLKAKQDAEALQASRNALSKQIGALKGKAKKEPEKAAEYEAQAAGSRLRSPPNPSSASSWRKEADELAVRVREIMMKIPNIIDPSVPIGPDDSCNVEVQRFGEAKVPDFDVPYHADIMAAFNGLDPTSARRVSGTGFYYLLGDIARLHEAVLAYARDFMINKGLHLCHPPPYMIRGEMVEGVMSFPEMDAMMYKIEDPENKDPRNSLYLIGTSEHSMIARFNGQIIPRGSAAPDPDLLLPCFRKEKGSTAWRSAASTASTSLKSRR